MRVIAFPSTAGRARIVRRPPTLELLDTQVASHASTAPISRATAPSEARAERADAELGPQLWYALFLSAFLVGLLVLGGFWISLNVRFL